MFKAISRWVMKYKWIVIIFWIALAAFVIFKAPILSTVAKNDQEKFLQESAESFKAAELTKKLYPDKGDGATAIITLNRNDSLKDEDSSFAKDLENYFKSNDKKFDIKSIKSPFSDENLKEQMISKNNKAALIMVELNNSSNSEKSAESIKDMRKVLSEGFNLSSKSVKAPSGLSLNVTGDTAFLTDENAMVNKSMDSTTRITIVLVLVVLIIIYKSPVAPFLPLLTIGLSFAISSGIIAALTKYGFRVSSYTEMFLIAVLFGAGTDYCLLLISRYREELSNGRSPEEALNISLPSTGESVVSSAGTVLIGFLFMGLAKFGLYNTTGPSVAIGVFITLLMVITMVPALIAVIGPRIFWPFHKKLISEKKHGSSGTWSKVAKTVTSRPGAFIIVIVALALPFAIYNKNIVRSFDQISEIPTSTDSAKGFKVIKDNFNQGEMLPIKVVLKSNKDMWDPTSLSVLEEVANRISLSDNVAKVRTATRPAGEVLTEATINKQIDALSKGLRDMNGGISPMVEGLNKMQTGVNSVSSGLKEGSDKTKLLVDGTAKAKDGVLQVSGGLQSLSQGEYSTIEGLNQINGGLDSLKIGINNSVSGVSGVSDAIVNAQKSLEALVLSHPELLADINYQTAYGIIKNSSQGLNKINQGLSQIQGGIASNQAGIKQSNDALLQINSGMLSSSDALNKIGTGLNESVNGQTKLSSSLASAATGLNSLSQGFDPIKSGLSDMSGGLNKIIDFTNDYSKNGKSIFYLPKSAFEQYPALKDAMKYYISPDGKGVTLEVVLSTQPYSNTSLDKATELRSIVKDALKGTSLEGSEFYVGGATSLFNDIRDTTAKDFTNVMIFVLLGIFVVLILLLRSLIAPLYLLVTIILSYASTMGITYFVFHVILGYDGISWAVPFFTFCVLVALGIDYNIFLMARVKEEYTYGDIKGSVERAVSTTGQIITSCGIIMAGTFGAMMSASVRSMAEVGFATVVGLLLDTFIIRCLLVPAIAVKMGELNFWPWNKRKI